MAVSPSSYDTIRHDTTRDASLTQGFFYTPLWGVNTPLLFSVHPDQFELVTPLWGGGSSLGQMHFVRVLSADAVRPLSSLFAVGRHGGRGQFGEVRVSQRIA